MELGQSSNSSHTRETAVKVKTSLAALLALGAVSGAALAQNAQWDGFYIGLNAGVLTNSTCTNWTPTNPAVIARFNTSNCPSNSVFLGGGQLGYNWQINQIVIGLEGDYDGVNSKTKSRIYDYPGGAVVPAGTFSFYGKNTPNGLGTIRARFGYALDNWLPYVTAGAALAGGSTRSSATFTPLNATAPTASFAGGRTYSSNGWTAGAGVEYQIERAWSVKAEWLYVKLGSGANQVSSCTTTVAGGCDAFGNLNLQSTSNSVSANVFRWVSTTASAPMRHPSRSQRSQPPWLRHPRHRRPHPRRRRSRLHCARTHRRGSQSIGTAAHAISRRRSISRRIRRS